MLRHLHPLVNVIVVVGKSDLLTSKEREAFRGRVLSGLTTAGVSCYEFPRDAEDGSGADAPTHPPFFVSSSVDGAARKYPWGSHDPRNPAHSDFMTVRRLLVATHMNSLVRATHFVKYVRLFSFSIYCSGNMVS